MSMLQEKYRYSAYKQYGKELEDIIKEKACPTDVSNMLRLVFPVMIEYYGSEYKDVLLNTLKEIKIKKPSDHESMYDIVVRHTPDNLEERSQTTAVSESELKKASGVHSLVPILEIIDGQIVLVGKSEVVSVKESNDTLDNLASWVHELSHAIKSNQNSMSLLQDDQGNQILVKRSGLSVVYSKVYVEGEKIIVEDIKEMNIGLEEGINTFDENAIINKILTLPKDQIPYECQDLINSLELPTSKTEYASSGYVQETLCADKLLNHCGLKSLVRKDQLLGTNQCEQAYNNLCERSENNWKQLNSKIDLSVKHTYERYKHFGDTNWLSQTIPEIIGNLKEIHSMLEESAKNQNMFDLKRGE